MKRFQSIAGATLIVLAAGTAPPASAENLPAERIFSTQPAQPPLVVPPLRATSRSSKATPARATLRQSAGSPHNAESRIERVEENFRPVANENSVRHSTGSRLN